MPNVWSSQLAGALHGRLLFPSVVLTHPVTSSNAAKTPIHNSNRFIFNRFQKKDNAFITSYQKLNTQAYTMRLEPY